MLVVHLHKKDELRFFFGIYQTRIDLQTKSSSPFGIKTDVLEFTL